MLWVGAACVVAVVGGGSVCNAILAISIVEKGRPAVSLEVLRFSRWGMGVLAEM